MAKDFTDVTRVKDLEMEKRNLDYPGGYPNRIEKIPCKEKSGGSESEGGKPSSK